MQSTCGFDGVLKGNYFGGEPIKRAEVEVRVGKLNRKDAKWWTGFGICIIWLLRVVLFHSTSVMERGLNLVITCRDLSRVSRVNENLIDDEQGGFQSREGACRSDLHPKADRGESIREEM